MLKKICCILISFALFSSISVAFAEKDEYMAEIFVSTEGDDSNNGSIDAPFATIERAKQEVSKYNKNMTNNIVVYFREGIYDIDKTVEFNPEDSGKNGYKILYKNYDNENVTLSGGKKVNNWSLFDANTNIWVADAEKWQSRQMYVNGERRQRASAREDQIIQFKGIGDSTTEAAILTENNQAPYFAEYGNLTDIEIIWKFSFSDYHMCVQGVDGDKVIMPEKFIEGAHNPYHNGKTNYKVKSIENAFEFLDDPGEWYLNKTEGKVYYKPLKDEDINNENVYLSDSVQTIIRLNGNPDNNISDISFDGLKFSYTNWTQPNDPKFGYPNFQAGYTREFYSGYPDNDCFFPKAAFEAQYCNNISFSNNKVEHCGGAGVWFKVGSKNINIIGNEFTDISQNGVMIGSHLSKYGAGEKNYVSYIMINNNLMHNIGYEFLGCVAIWAGYYNFSDFSHNEIFDMPYTGISVGWGFRNQWGDGSQWNFSNEDAWKTNPNFCWNNKIQYNNIYDVMKIANDGSAIYVLGVNAHLDISNNYLHDSVIDRAQVSCAIYLDNGNRFVNVKNNISHDIPVVLYCKGGDNVVTDNFFDEWYTSSRISTDQTKGWWEAGEYLPKGASQDNIISNTVIKNGYFPIDIIANSGLEYDYQKLKINGDINENILIGKKAYMIDSNQKVLKSSSGKDAANAIDGDETTSAKATTSGNWIYQVDIGEQRNINKVDLQFDTVPDKFKILFSDNAVDWTGEEYEGVETISIKPNVHARLIRIELTEGKMSIKEIQAYADDFVKKVTADDLFSGINKITFMDINGHWAQKNIERLASLKILLGVDVYRYLPDSYMTRAEWCTAISRLLDYQKEVYAENFDDVNKDAWYSDYIQTCYKHGIMDVLLSGEKEIRPDEFITREEAAAFIYLYGLNEIEENQSNYIDLSDTSPWALQAVTTVSDAGIMSGDENGRLNPQSNITRAEAATVLSRLQEYVLTNEE